MPQMSARVEEFYNRVHSPRDGRFATSGTGGGHYKGRASGAKQPGGGSPRSRRGPQDNSAAYQHQQNVNRRGTAAWLKDHPEGRKAAAHYKAAGAKTGHEGVKPAHVSTNASELHNSALARRNTARWLRDHPVGRETAARLKAKGLKTGFDKVDPNKKVTNKKDFVRSSPDKKRRYDRTVMPKKEGGDTAKLNEIMRLKQQLLANR